MRATTAALNDYIKTSSSPIMPTLDQQHPFMTNGNNELPLNHHHQQLQNNNSDPLHFDPAYWNMNDNVLDMAKLFDTSIWSMDPNASSSSSSSSNTTTPTHSFFDLSMKQTSYQSHPLIHPTHISHQQQQQQQQQRWIQSLPTPIYNNNNSNSNNNSNNNISSSQSFIYNSSHNTNINNNTMLPPSPPIESSSTPTIASPLTTTTTCSTTSSTSPLSHPTYMLHSMPLSLHDQQSYQQPMIMTTPFHPNMNSLSANHHSPPSSTSIQSNSPFIHPPPPSSSSSSILHHHHHHQHHQQQQKNNNKIYRRQSDQHPYRKNSNSNNNNPVRRRASSVASVVSLTAHEPVAHVINGIEHITFLYSHDRLVKEYTVRTDVQHVELDIIPMEFRLQNAIYPRANVEKEEYDGNRWNYETSCNELGWKLCWLNREQLYGKRGLIQRAVDSYRNRHAELRSRRVTRQEKVANGTLRKRRTKKALSNPFF